MSPYTYREIDLIRKPVDTVDKKPVTFLVGNHDTIDSRSLTPSETGRIGQSPAGRKRAVAQREEP